MTKEQKQTAQSIFDKNKDVDTLYMNPKGEFFTSKNLGLGSLKKDEKMETVKRALETSGSEGGDEGDEYVSIPKLKEQVIAIPVIPVLEQMLLDEQSGQNRKGAIEVIEARIQELKTV